MNKAFKKGVIQLEDNIWIEADAFKVCVLVFLEMKENKKEEIKPFRNEFHYPRITQALSKYVEVTSNNSKSIEELNQTTIKIYALLNEINNKFKQF
jgi:hypothetical protein